MLCFKTLLAVIKDVNCEESIWRSLSALVWPLSNVMLDAKISLVPTHQLIVPSTILALATNIRTYKDTKATKIRTGRLSTENGSAVDRMFVKWRAL